MSTLLDDAFKHHAWANDRILEACARLTDEQLATPEPGTYGPILATLRHLIGSDNWYLWVITEERHPEFQEETAGMEELKAGARSSAAGWEALLSGEGDPDQVAGGAGGRRGCRAAAGLRPGPADPPRPRPSKPDLHGAHEPRHRAARHRPL